ncbi:hypothetical protein [Brevibacillus migulae]|uniref:hypothetical protein n=1 Tax=Brevibacillus migulae TaxID=1644114 RepID=UPI00106E5DF6|nr:hypothetical protein [Brevibacillus migulae]
MMKKWSVLFLALMLLLAGCSGQASLVRDTVVASLDHPNYDYQTTFKLSGDKDKLFKLAEEENDPELTAILKALEAGFKLTGSQQDLQKAKMVIEMNDEQVLRDQKLWSGDQKASLEVLVDTNDVYVKTPLDQKYLQLSNNIDTSISAEEMKDFQEKAQKLTLSFLKKYIPKFGYKLSQVKNHGKETVKLPNGESVETTHLSITLDMKEIIQLLRYIAEDATTNAEVKNFAVDFLVMTGEIAEKNDPTMKMTPAERRTQAEAMVTLGLQELKQWLETEGKEYTPEKIVELAKEEGIDGLNLTLDYYIDQNKLTVKQVSDFSITVNDETLDAKPVTFGFAADTLAWNYGKATAINVPKAADVVNYEDLKKDDKALEAFDENGFLRAIIDFSLEEQGYEADLGSMILP